MDIQKTEAMIELLKKELGPIADALGQGAGKTFEIFVKQAWVNAFQQLLLTVGGLVLFVISIVMFRYGHRKPKQKGVLRETEWEGMEWIVLIGGLSISLLLILVPIAGIIQVVVNPEYAALQLMLDTFRTAR